MNPNNPDKNNLLFFAPKTPENKELVNELLAENFHVYQLSKLGELIKWLNDNSCSIIIMDFSGNEIACLEFCHFIKSNNAISSSTVIIISNNTDEYAEIAAFRAGVDDFIIKPLRYGAFIQRLRAKMKLPGNIINVSSATNHTSQIHIDRLNHSVFVNNNSLELSRKEFELLYMLASNPHKSFTRNELFEKIWTGSGEGNNKRTIDVHIMKLRKKLGVEVIKTRKGVGYCFAS